MLATFAIEICLAFFTLVRYKMTTITRLVVIMLTLLAVFQLAEYNVCREVGLTATIWSRIGYIAITMLPPLSIHLIQTISHRKWQLLTWLSYLSGATFAIIFGFSKFAFAGHVCAGNYAIFQLASSVGGAYFVYYYSWLFIGVILSLFLSIHAKQKVREALILQVFGYLSFLLPTGIVNTINPKTIEGIPSVMCGFAVIYAFVLVCGIMPLTLNRKRAIH